MKIRNKLILSCAALAAVATTAVSTTFAWYTSNNQVTVGTITANTKNAGSDLLMIADGLKTATVSEKVRVQDVALDALNWDTKITSITTNAMDAVNGAQAQLTPLAYNGKVKGLKYSAATDATAEAADTAGALTMIKSNGDSTTPLMVTDTTKTTDDSGYLHFVLYLKNGGTAAKTVTMKLKNLTNVTAASTAGLPTKSIVNPTANRTNLGLQSTSTLTSYSVDALRVAAVDLEIANVVDTAWTGTPATGTTKVREVANETIYDLKSSNASFSASDTLGSSTSYDAHAYYNSIMTPDLDTADVYNKNTSAFNSLGGASGVELNVQVPAGADHDNFIQLDFKVFLNGWDKACFDACQAQQFTFDLEFTIPVATE